MKRLKTPRLTRFGILAIGAAFLGGCAEQPYGYIFVPSQRDQVNAARQAANFIGALYDHADAASGLLDKAGLTDDYASILPEGWVDITARDSNGNPLAPFFHFYKNYLDKELSELQIDRAALPGSVRTPSTLRYNYYTSSSIQNFVTNEFYGTVDQVQKAEIRYADNLQNLKFIEGWYSISKTVPFEQEIEIQALGRSTNVTYLIYLEVGWSLRVEHFSIDTKDQTSSITIEGQFPILDETGTIQRCHISGKFDIDSKGQGGGDIWLFGQPAARLTFTGRSFGFKGKFSLFSEDHKRSYSL